MSSSLLLRPLHLHGDGAPEVAGTGSASWASLNSSELAPRVPVTFTSRLNYVFLAVMLILLFVLQFVYLCVILAYL